MVRTTKTPARKAPAKAPARKAPAKPIVKPELAKPEPTAYEKVKAAEGNPVPPKPEPKKVIDHPAEVTAIWSEFHDAAKRAAFTSRRLHLPILSAAYITLDPQGRVVVRATDLETWTETAMPSGFLDGHIRLLVNARVLLTALVGIKGVNTAAQACHERISLIRGKDGSTTMAGFGRTLRLDANPGDDDDYPEFPKLDKDERLVDLPSGELVDSFSFAMTAAGRDGTLPMLTGVKMVAAKQGVTFVATDRYRIAVIEPQAIVHVPFEALVPARAFPVLKDLTGPVAIYGDPKRKGDGYLRFVSGSRSVTQRLLDATFPAYQSLIPTVDLAKWTVNRPQLIGDVIAAAAAKDDKAPVRLTLEPGKWQVEGGELQLADCIAVTESWTTAFNPAFLLAGLRLFHGDTVTITGTGATKPLLLTGRRNGSRSIYLAMPVRLPG